MRKLLIFFIIAVLLAGSLSACGFIVNKEPYMTLKDIDFTAKGIYLTGYHQDLLLSPDGRKIACSGYYYNNDNNNVSSRLVLADLSSGETTAFNNADKVLAWLPDSHTLVYQYEGTLYLLNTGTGKKTEIAQDSWFASVSPDGRQLAYAKLGDGLFIYDIETGQSKRLTKNNEDRYPVWYPDGKHLFYFCDLGKQLGDGAGYLQGMAKISVATGQIERITEAEGKFRQAQWLIPGRALHIISGWDDGYSHAILNLERQKYVELGENIIGDAFFVTVDTGKGQLIKSYRGQVEIYDELGDKIKSYCLPETHQTNFNYTVSPRGDKLAFVQGDFGRFGDSQINGNQVKISDYDGQNVHTLTPEYKYNDSIVWHPDGQNIIALQMDQEKILGIKILAVP
ncbi:PD40 domain-containing protein [Desulforamulus hydrothermalis]|uniref:WD40-like Beta Propeller Repeat n=1 Tax=Desulforamulus hydrothermalis Lam5 = DSM 18033 TaxID=1121428 RepID=K8E6E2_9FIRM|nr:PD40 domain-containing protein [Desulforamulus hydrothermalis]CCO07048.1 exported hypothetical protein [Desulforamulus hydrothermalis Lam5 = DSM 18033]SHG96839.1 WD40-like Beta Propeller Repeat [Desulforamulus hydrothermalis Lam5 = DSM 18033]